SYLKVIHNPDDSISLLRVLNNPPRGLGKGTLETLERIALEAGLSLWAAIGQAEESQLLPLRACAALRNFKELIEDSRAMLAGTYVERLQETAQPETRSSTSEAPDPVFAAPDDSDDISFDFGDLPERLSHTSTALPSADSTNGAHSSAEADPAFREPAAPANTAEVLKFLIDRTG